MSEPTMLDHMVEAIKGQFPWMARIGLAASKALQIRSPVGRTEIEGGTGVTLYALLRAIADSGGRLAFDPGDPGLPALPALYYSANGGDYVPVTMLPAGSTLGGTVPTLPAATPGTTIVLGPGSTRVSCG